MRHSMARVALEALKGEKTMAQLSSEYGVHANQIRQWRQRLLDEVPHVFRSSPEAGQRDGHPSFIRHFDQYGWQGPWMDNVFIERLWKSIKYEDIYLKAYSSMTEVKNELTNYFEFYYKRR